MTSIQRLPQTTTDIYLHLHARLTEVAMTARKGGYSRFESVNRSVYEDARLHLGAIEDATGEALDTALLRAGAWLAGL